MQQQPAAPTELPHTARLCMSAGAHPPDCAGTPAVTTVCTRLPMHQQGVSAPQQPKAQPLPAAVCLRPSPLLGDVANQGDLCACRCFCDGPMLQCPQAAAAAANALTGEPHKWCGVLPVPPPAGWWCCGHQSCGCASHRAATAAAAPRVCGRACGNKQDRQQHTHSELAASDRSRMTSQQQLVLEGPHTTQVCHMRHLPCSCPQGCASLLVCPVEPCPSSQQQPHCSHTPRLCSQQEGVLA